MRHYYKLSNNEYINLSEIVFVETPLSPGASFNVHLTDGKKRTIPNEDYPAVCRFLDSSLNWVKNVPMGIIIFLVALALFFIGTRQESRQMGDDYFACSQLIKTVMKANAVPEDLK